MQLGEEEVNAIDHLFRIDLQSKITNQQNPDEPEEIKSESTTKLSCIIDNQGKAVNSIQEGIEAAFTGEIEKFSESL